MEQKRLTAQCEFEEVSADDLIDGIGTLSGRYGQGVIVPPPGDGPDRPLSWAIRDVSTAPKEPDADERDRLCTSAVLNSRRALACLVDWYVERDLGNRCKTPPGSPKEKAEFLVRRGIIDELTSHVLARAIHKRNVVEHDYVAPTLDTAEDVVELLRRTMATIRSQSDPSCAPWIFGVFLGSHGYGKDGAFARFGGWSDPLIVFSRFPPRPWVGIVLPKTEEYAIVRHAYLSNVSDDELIQLLGLAEQRYGRGGSFCDQTSCELMARTLGLSIEK